MREGWLGKDYLILFEPPELTQVSENYSFANLLPGYKLVGLRGWDDFIVEDGEGKLFTVPTVPVDRKYLAPVQLPVFKELEADRQLEGKIKWYLKPLVFGGDPSTHQNQVWISHNQHSQLVRYWNGVYQSVNAKASHA